jgi:hypothetical protein
VIFKGGRFVEKGRYRWVLLDDSSNIISVIKLKPYIISFTLNEDFLIDYQGKSFVIHYKARKAPHYILILGEVTYMIIVHKGNKLSVFKNDQQIGSLEESAFTIGFETTFKLIIDDDLDLPFIATLIYACTCTKETNDANINFSLGNIGPELKVFNNEWNPKN